MKDVFDFAKHKKGEISEPFLVLPTEIKELLDERSQQAARGEVSTHEKVMAEVPKKYTLSK